MTFQVWATKLEDGRIYHQLKLQTPDKELAIREGMLMSRCISVLKIEVVETSKEEIVWVAGGPVRGSVRHTV